jgi:hypothetical protein
MVEHMHADLITHDGSSEHEGGEDVTPRKAGGNPSRRRSSLSLEEQAAVEQTDPDKPQGNRKSSPQVRTAALDWRTMFLAKVRVVHVLRRRYLIPLIPLPTSEYP